MSATNKKNTQLVKVFVRARPMSKTELESRDQKAVNVIQRITGKDICIKSGFTKKNYNFDKVFGEEATQVEIYDTIVRPQILSVITGYNCTIFAYGQTGTGKTHTIIGNIPVDKSSDVNLDPKTGVIPRATVHLFKELHKLDPRIEYTVRVSFIEIYNEDVRDLLHGCTILRIYEDPDNKGSVVVKNVKEVTVCNTTEVHSWLRAGLEARASATTCINVHSSRSHCLFTISVHTREITAEGEEIMKTGKLHLVDLAGSENISRSGAVDHRAREAGNINKSLLTLGKVIKALAQRTQHVPYRESKLTRILQDSLGGNTKTCMIATISPCMVSWEETVSTLDYATEARHVANCPEINVNKKRADFLNDLQAEINKLRNELAIARSGAGFYISNEAYDAMTREIDSNHEKIISLVAQIKDLEEYRDTRELECTRLAESFETTKQYLSQIDQELKQKKSEVDQKNFFLNYMKRAEKNLSKTTQQLLEVCESSTKHEEIYFNKYQLQCDTTLANASLAKSIASTSGDCIKVLKSAGKNYMRTCEERINTINTTNERLQHDHLREINNIGELSSDMEAQIDKKNDLTLETVLKNKSINYSETELNNYFNAVFNTNLTNLEAQTQLKDMLNQLKNHVVNTNNNLRTKSNECNNSYHIWVDQVSHHVTTLHESLDLINRELDETGEQLQDQNRMIKEFTHYVTNFMSGLNKKHEESITKVASLKNKLEKIRSDVDGIQHQTASTLKDSIVEYTDYQSQTGAEQLAIITEVAAKAVEQEKQLESDTIANKAKINNYVSGLIDTIKENLAHYNTCLKNTVHGWIDRASTINENLAQSVEQSVEIINKTTDAMSEDNKDYVANVNKHLVVSLEQLEKQRNSIIFDAHAGDTPVKKTYSYPRRFPKVSSEETILRLYERQKGVNGVDPVVDQSGG